MSLALLAGLALLHPPVARAAGITVTTANEGQAGGDGCSLREAILNANNDNQSGSTECAAGSGADTITFAGNYTIILATALPTLSTNLTIDGSGRSVTVSGNNAVQVFLINGSGVVTLSNLSLIDGSATFGGGINNGGTLTVSNSTFSGNSAGTNGGGISNVSTLHLRNSLIANSPSGGDCLNFGTIATNLNNLPGSCRFGQLQPDQPALYLDRGGEFVGQSVGLRPACHLHRHRGRACAGRGDTDRSGRLCA